MQHGRFKAALALSGGGSRALAHLGVLNEVLANHMQVDLLVGTSMGAVIGGLYAFYGSLPAVSQKMREFLHSDLFVNTLSRATESTVENGAESLFDRFLGLLRKGIFYTQSIMRPTLVSEEAYLEVMSQLIPAHPIERLPIPFAAVAMDIVSGEEVVVRSGSLRSAVSASVAIPGILPPVQYDGRLLVDGGWIDNVPAAPAIAMGAHFVMGVDASMQTFELGPRPASALDLFHRSNDLTRILLSHERRKCSDVLLLPPIGYLNWADFSRMDHCVAAGREVVRKNLWHLRRMRLRRKALSLNGWLHPARSPAWRRPLVML